MAPAKQGVPPAQTDIAHQPFNGIVVQGVVVPEDVIAQGVILAQGVVDRFG